MKDQDRERFDLLMRAACVAFDKERDRTLLRLYWDACKHMTIDEFEDAMNTHLRSQRFFPRPADLIGDDAELKAVEAWRIAIDAVHHAGMYHHVDFEDRAINAAIRSIGGWISFCETPQAAESFLRNSFVKAYVAYCRRGVSEDAGRPLPGLGEATRVHRDKAGNIERIECTPKMIGCSSTMRRIVDTNSRKVTNRVSHDDRNRIEQR